MASLIVQTLPHGGQESGAGESNILEPKSSCGAKLPASRAVGPGAMARPLHSGRALSVVSLPFLPSFSPFLLGLIVAGEESSPGGLGRWYSFSNQEQSQRVPSRFA